MLMDKGHTRMRKAVRSQIVYLDKEADKRLEQEKIRFDV